MIIQSGRGASHGAVATAVSNATAVAAAAADEDDDDGRQRLCPCEPRNSEVSISALVVCGYCGIDVSPSAIYLCYQKMWPAEAERDARTSTPVVGVWLAGCVAKSVCASPIGL